MSMAPALPGAAAAGAAGRLAPAPPRHAHAHAHAHVSSSPSALPHPLLALERLYELTTPELLTNLSQLVRWAAQLAAAPAPATATSDSSFPPSISLGQFVHLEKQVLLIHRELFERNQAESAHAAASAFAAAPREAAPAANAPAATASPSAPTAPPDFRPDLEPSQQSSPEAFLFALEQRLQRGGATATTSSTTSSTSSITTTAHASTASHSRQQLPPPPPFPAAQTNPHAHPHAHPHALDSHRSHNSQQARNLFKRRAGLTIPEEILKQGREAVMLSSVPPPSHAAASNAASNASHPSRSRRISAAATSTTKGRTRGAAASAAPAATAHARRKSTSSATAASSSSSSSSSKRSNQKQAQQQPQQHPSKQSTPTDRKSRSQSTSTTRPARPAAASSSTTPSASTSLSATPKSSPTATRTSSRQLQTSSEVSAASVTPSDAASSAAASSTVPTAAAAAAPATAAATTSPTAPSADVSSDASTSLATATTTTTTRADDYDDDAAPAAVLTTLVPHVELATRAPLSSSLMSSSPARRTSSLSWTTSSDTIVESVASISQTVHMRFERDDDRDDTARVGGDVTIDDDDDVDDVENYYFGAQDRAAPAPFALAGAALIASTDVHSVKAAAALADLTAPNSQLQQAQLVAAAASSNVASSEMPSESAAPAPTSSRTVASTRTELPTSSSSYPLSASWRLYCSQHDLLAFPSPHDHAQREHQQQQPSHDNSAQPRSPSRSPSPTRSSSPSPPEALVSSTTAAPTRNTAERAVRGSTRPSAPIPKRNTAGLVSQLPRPWRRSVSAAPSRSSVPPTNRSPSASSPHSSSSSSSSPSSSSPSPPASPSPSPSPPPGASASSTRPTKTKTTTSTAKRSSNASAPAQAPPALLPPPLPVPPRKVPAEFDDAIASIVPSYSAVFPSFDHMFSLQWELYPPTAQSLSSSSVAAFFPSGSSALYLPMIQHIESCERFRLLHTCGTFSHTASFVSVKRAKPGSRMAGAAAGAPVASTAVDAASPPVATTAGTRWASYVRERIVTDVTCALDELSRFPRVFSNDEVVTLHQALSLRLLRTRLTRAMPSGAAVVVSRSSSSSSSSPSSSSSSSSPLALPAAPSPTIPVLANSSAALPSNEQWWTWDATTYDLPDSLDRRSAALAAAGAVDLFDREEDVAALTSALVFCVTDEKVEVQNVVRLALLGRWQHPDLALWGVDGGASSSGTSSSGATSGGTSSVALRNHLTDYFSAAPVAGGRQANSTAATTHPTHAARITSVHAPNAIYPSAWVQQPLLAWRTLFRSPVSDARALITTASESTRLASDSSVPSGSSAASSSSSSSSAANAPDAALSFWQFAPAPTAATTSVTTTTTTTTTTTADGASSRPVLTLPVATYFNLLWTWRCPPASLFSQLLFCQRVNHFPLSKHLTRKDLLQKNIERMLALKGDRAAEYWTLLPKTLVLPRENVKLVEEFTREHMRDAAHNYWIVKPPGLSRGRGIRVIDSLNDIKYGEPLVVQKYIVNPLLLRGHKFDLRLYLLVTSFAPLEAFLYREGFARVALVPFHLDAARIGDRFMHLTNSSIQRTSDAPLPFDLPPGVPDGGSKVSLATLVPMLQAEYPQLAFETMWARIRTLMLKTLVCAEDEIGRVAPPNCFEMYGFDVLIDDTFRPWLIEVNASPSMGLDTPLDRHIKPTLIRDTVRLIDPLPFSRSVLAEYCLRRLRTSYFEPSASPSRASRATACNVMMSNVLDGRAPRTYGELPQALGVYERIAPHTKEFEQVMRMKRQGAQPQPSGPAGASSGVFVSVGA